MIRKLDTKWNDTLILIAASKNRGISAYSPYIAITGNAPTPLSLFPPRTFPLSLNKNWIFFFSLREPIRKVGAFPQNLVGSAEKKPVPVDTRERAAINAPFCFLLQGSFPFSFIVFFWRFFLLASVLFPSFRSSASLSSHQIVEIFNFGLVSLIWCLFGFLNCHLSWDQHCSDKILPIWGLISLIWKCF